MEHENQKRNDSVFSRKIRAGRRRTYFFDVRTTRGNDYYLTITESKKRFDGNGYERHKIFLYKEDFNKFIEETTAVIDHIKSLMPDFDFDAFSHKYDENAVSNPGHDNDHDHTHDSHGDDDHTVTHEEHHDHEEQQEERHDENPGGGHHDDDDLKL